MTKQSGLTTIIHLELGLFLLRQYSALQPTVVYAFFSSVLLLGMVLYDNLVLGSPKVLFCSVI